MTKKLLALAGLLMGICGSCFGAQGAVRVDFWVEGPRLFGTAKAGGDIVGDLDKRRLNDYRSKEFFADHADRRAGDFSILYTAAKANSPEAIGFCSGLWQDSWQLSGEWSLHLWLKAEASEAPGRWLVVLLDTKARRAVGEVKGMEVDGQWREFNLPLGRFEREEGFDFDRVRVCQLEVKLAADAKLWFDGVYFFNGKTNEEIGVTDKTVEQRMAEAQVSRAARVEHAFAYSSNKGFKQLLNMSFAKLWKGKELDETNKNLQAWFTGEWKDKRDHWDLFLTPTLCRMYYLFNSKTGRFPDRLEPATEAALLDLIWQRTVEKNDIYQARMSTWWLQGSENHDVNAKACNLVSSRIFMNEPAYAKRVYPDVGFGGGYHYGHPGYFGKEKVDRKMGGRANLSDGTKYVARDHYEEWVRFFKEYFRERAKRGFFVERSSLGYMKYTMNFIDLVYAHGGDDELHELTKEFMDLAYADWAQEAISGIRGGPKTRHHKNVGGYGAMTQFMQLYLGGPGDGTHSWYCALSSDYELPKVVWSLALDRRGLGCYEFISRGIGEEENLWPRPLGQERTLLCDTDSRFVKYSYVTPDYILGTQMDHPAAVHSHLSIGGRWQGMIFSQSPASRVVPMSFETEDPDDWGIHMEGMNRNVQSKKVLITQQSRRWINVNPDWFPAYDGLYDSLRGVYFGKDWDRMEEKGGWIFVQRGNAYAAVRPVMWDKEHDAKKGKGPQVGFVDGQDVPTATLKDDSYTWNEEHTIIKLKDKFSPVIIEASRVVDHPTWEFFVRDILDNPVRLYKTVVTGYFVLTYTGCGDDAQEIVFNAATNEIPMVGGKHIDYSYPMTFDSPYMKSPYKTGVILIEKDDERLTLDFNKEY